MGAFWTDLGNSSQIVSMENKQVQFDWLCMKLYLFKAESAIFKECQHNCFMQLSNFTVIGSAVVLWNYLQVVWQPVSRERKLQTLLM